MFSGTEDHCRCFFCGGGLRRWEEDDFPWTEHARWYPTCPFVRQCKGESFIDAVQKGRNPELDELVSIKYFYENIYISLGKYKLLAGNTCHSDDRDTEYLSTEYISYSFKGTMVILEGPTVTVKCRTAIKAMFFFFFKFVSKCKV